MRQRRLLSAIQIAEFALHQLQQLMMRNASVTAVIAIDGAEMPSCSA